MNDELKRILKGSGRDQIDVTSGQFTILAFVWRDGGHPQIICRDDLCPDRYSNLIPLEYKSTALPLE
jgi:hypothetical protein